MVGPLQFHALVHDSGSFHPRFVPISWMGADYLIHDFGLFHGREPLFCVLIHENRLIYGRDVVFCVLIHVLGLFHGQQH